MGKGAPGEGEQAAAGPAEEARLLREHGGLVEQLRRAVHTEPPWANCCTKCFFVSIGGPKEFFREFPIARNSIPTFRIVFRSGQCQADSPTVRNVSHWAKSSLSRLSMDPKKHFGVRGFVGGNGPCRS